MKKTPQEYQARHAHFRRKREGPVTTELCTGKMEALSFMNQGLDHEANQVLKEMQEIAKERDALLKKLDTAENKMTALRMGLRVIREKWAHNFEDYARWRKARREIYRKTKN